MKAVVCRRLAWARVGAGNGTHTARSEMLGEGSRNRPELRRSALEEFRHAVAVQVTRAGDDGRSGSSAPWRHVAAPA
jgi:hypothetical protein